MRIWPLTWIFRVLLSILIVFAAYSLGAYYGVPALLRYIACNPARNGLDRKVAVGEVSFNPYKLRLIVDNLRIAERDTDAGFVDIGRVDVRLSWTSIYRMALVVKEIAVERPSFHLVRVAPQSFNFSDLVQPAPTPQQPSKPRQFAISNIRLNDGQILFDDRVLKHRHQIDHIRLQIPFIANLPTDVDNYVQPLLGMTVDGSPFDIVGKTKLFGSSRESIVNLSVNGLVLTSYIDYVPVKLPVKLRSAILSSVLQVSFVEAREQPKIRIRGTVGVDDIIVRDPGNAPLAELKALQVEMADVEPLSSLFHLSLVKIDSLSPHLVLNHDGTTNLTRILGGPPAAIPQPAPSQTALVATTAQRQPTQKSNPVVSSEPQSSLSTQAFSAKPVPASTFTPGLAAPSTSSGPHSAATPAPAPASVSMVAAAPASSPTPVSSRNSAPSGSAPELAIDSLQLNDSALDFHDLAGDVPVVLKLHSVNATVTNFSNKLITKPTSYSVNASLGTGGQLSVAGDLNLTGSEAGIKLALNQIDIPSLQALAQSALAGVITSGKLSAHAAAKVAFAPGRFTVSSQPSVIAIDSFGIRAPDGQQNLIGWKHFQVKLAKADLISRTVTVQEVRSDGLQLALERDRRGNVNLLSLLRLQPEPETKPSRGVSRRRRSGNHMALSERRPAAQSRSRTKNPARAPSANQSGGWQYVVETLALENTQVALVERAGQRRMRVEFAPLNINLKGISNDLAKPIAIGLDGRINRKGTFKIAGRAALQPVKAQLRIETRRIDLATLDPFITSQLNARIMRLEFTMKGQALAEMRRNKINASYRGNLAFGNVRILDKLTGEDFLKWYGLQLNRMELAYGAGRPRMHIGEIALNNFYSRIILNSNGQLNLSDVMSNPQKAPVSLTRAHGASAPAAVPSASPAAAPSPVPAIAPNPAPASSAIPADIAIGSITLKGGQVNYTDNFIKPNYSADLTEMEGKIGSFSTASIQPAEVALSGKVNGSAPIAISGTMNPLTPLASVDIKANANGIELTPLAMYSTKYTGYPITEGTLTVDVHYLLANQQLTAQNHIILDQLTFGDRVANSTARNLPIRLAVALLKDSNGRIDLSIPVTGSLADPQFSIGHIILQAFLNLLLKAVTSPFSLITSLAGGTNQNLSYVEFAPGYATLTDKATAKLDLVAKALQQKPSLKLTITGAVDPALDRSGLREAMLDYAMRRRKADIEGSISNEELDKVKLTPDEYEKYLRRVYKAADFEKPRDLIGMNKSLPAEEMKKLILAKTKVTDDDLRNLANARAEAVRRHLVAKIQPERLQTHAPRLNTNGAAAKAPTTVTDLSLQ